MEWMDDAGVIVSSLIPSNPPPPRTLSQLWESASEKEKKHTYKEEVHLKRDFLTCSEEFAVTTIYRTEHL